MLLSVPTVPCPVAVCIVASFGIRGLKVLRLDCLVDIDLLTRKPITEPTMSIPAASPNHAAKGSRGKRPPQCKLIWTVLVHAPDPVFVVPGRHPQSDGSEHAEYCPF